MKIREDYHDMVQIWMDLSMPSKRSITLGMDYVFYIGDLEKRIKELETDLKIASSNVIELTNTCDKYREQINELEKAAFKFTNKVLKDNLKALKK